MRHPTMISPLALTLSTLVWAACAAMPALAAQAAHSVPQELPPQDLVRQHILARPEVRAAASAMQADQADAERLKAGPHEFTLRLAAQQRRSSDTMSDGLIDRRRYAETQLALERTLRTGRKARQDDVIGDAAVKLAQVRRADAIHEASRGLLRAWIDWLRERATVSMWQEQESAQDELTRHAERRVKAGDAARTQWRLQEASAAQTHANLVGAQARELAARAVLDTQYPGLTSSGEAALASPQLLDYQADQQAVVTQDLAERSHEWRVARLHADLVSARATRTSLDRSTDPTIGIYAASERGGAERVLGLSLSVPLAGAARSASERQAQALRVEAEQQAEAIHQKVRTEAVTAWQAMQSAQLAWQSQDLARQRHEQVLKTVVRGWELGEYSQSDVLLARRQFTEAALAEINARAEARHAALRLKLDLHETWEFDDE